MSLGVVVLAGGTGKRLGERKAFTRLAGKPLLAHTLQAAQRISTDLTLVVEPQDAARPELGELDLEVRQLSDLEPGLGPLMGLYSALRVLPHDYVLALPCDTPFLSPRLLAHLVSLRGGWDAVVPRWRNGYLEPLHSVYRVEAARLAAEKALGEGERRLQALVSRLDRVRFVPVEDLEGLDPGLRSFWNINHRGELEEAEAMLRRGGLPARRV